MENINKSINLYKMEFSLEEKTIQKKEPIFEEILPEIFFEHANPQNQMNYKGVSKKKQVKGKKSPHTQKHYREM